ncbi:MAG: hypothetical protein AB7O99_07995, partial [Dongiaceae bacterium]
KKFEELLKDPRLQQMMALLEETLGSQALVGLDVKDILALLEQAEREGIALDQLLTRDMDTFINRRPYQAQQAVRALEWTAFLYVMMLSQQQNNQMNMMRLNQMAERLAQTLGVDVKSFQTQFQKNLPELRRTLDTSMRALRTVDRQQFNQQARQMARLIRARRSRAIQLQQQRNETLRLRRGRRPVQAVLENEVARPKTAAELLRVEMQQDTVLQVVKKNSNENPKVETPRLDNRLTEAALNQQAFRMAGPERTARIDAFVPLEPVNQNNNNFVPPPVMMDNRVESVAFNVARQVTEPFIEAPRPSTPVNDFIAPEPVRQVSEPVIDRTPTPEALRVEERLAPPVENYNPPVEQSRPPIIETAPSEPVRDFRQPEPIYTPPSEPERKPPIDATPPAVDRPLETPPPPTPERSREEPIDARPTAQPPRDEPVAQPEAKKQEQPAEKHDHDQRPPEYIVSPRDGALKDDAVKQDVNVQVAKNGHKAGCGGHPCTCGEHNRIDTEAKEYYTVPTPTQEQPPVPVLPPTPSTCNGSCGGCPSKESCQGKQSTVATIEEPRVDAAEAARARLAELRRQQAQSN